MAPPKFDDLNKQGVELFTKGYEHENHKIEFKNKANNMEFTLKGAHKHGTDNVVSSFETNVTNICKKLNFKKTINSNGKIDLELSKTDLVENLGKTTLTGSFNQNDNTFKAGLFKHNFTNSNFNVNLNSTLVKTPCVNFDAVFNYENTWNFGVAVGYDVGSSKITKNLVALNIVSGSMNTVFKSALDTGKPNLSAVVMNSISKNKQLGIKADISDSVKLALVMKNSDSVFGNTQVKIDCSGHMTASYNHNINNACNATLSSMVDMKDLSAGGHKVGCLLKFSI